MNDGRIYIQEELKSRNAPREGDFIGDLSENEISRCAR